MTIAISMRSFAEITSLAALRGVDIRTHSGKTGTGDIFVSLPRAVPMGPSGPDYSGAGKFLADAVRAGAGVVVCTQLVWDAACSVICAERTAPLAVVIVPDTRDALGDLAAARYGTDAAKVRLFAITGTNGKTTSAYLLEAILRASGSVPGVIGTVEYRWPGHEEPSPLTTPDTMALHDMVAAMHAAGADSALLEVSSHAIEQNRIAGLAFSGALFTNLTQDHLDYHKDMEAYFEVKGRLFKPCAGLLAQDAALAVNVDDPYGARIFATNPAVLGYGFAQKNARILGGALLEQGPTGLKLRMRHAGRTWDLESPLVGEFNAFNLLGAQALALALGVDDACLQALATFGGVPGRLERIGNRQGLSVFVDYAHTPDALKKALQALRGANFSRVITLFGCGGDRDRSKRPLMGEAAAALSDLVVLTSDNPRHEEPLAIMADVRPGLVKGKRVIEEADRKKAIGLALNELQPGEALLVAGKGHEPYQIIGDTKYPFSDQQVVREFLGCV